MKSSKYSIVRIADVKEGTKLVTDDGFTCMGDHVTRVVKRNSDGELYVSCAAEGREHLLVGQECGAGVHGVKYDHYIGFWIKGTEPPKEKRA